MVLAAVSLPEAALHIRRPGCLFPRGFRLSRLPTRTVEDHFFLTFTHPPIFHHVPSRKIRKVLQCFVLKTESIFVSWTCGLVWRLGLNSADVDVRVWPGPQFFAPDVRVQLCKIWKKKSLGQKDLKLQMKGASGRKWKCQETQRSCVKGLNGPPAILEKIQHGWGLPGP